MRRRRTGEESHKQTKETKPSLPSLPSVEVGLASPPPPTGKSKSFSWFWFPFCGLWDCGHWRRRYRDRPLRGVSSSSTRVVIRNERVHGRVHKSRAVECCHLRSRCADHFFVNKH